MKILYPQNFSHYNPSYFSGTSKPKPVSSIEATLRKDILEGKLFKNFQQLPRIQTTQTSFILSLLNNVPKDAPQAAQYIIQAATLYCLLHPDETDVLTKTLHVSKQTHHRYLYEALNFALYSSPNYAPKTIGGVPHSIQNITQLQQHFFAPLLTDLTAMAAQTPFNVKATLPIPQQCVRLLDSYCTDSIATEYENALNPMTVAVEPGYSERTLKQLLPPPKQTHSCLSRLLTPSNMPDSLRDGTYKQRIKPTLKRLHPEITQLLNCLTPEPGQAYLYKFYQNNYSEITGGPQLHPHLLLLQKLEYQHPEGRPQAFIQITYLDDERPLSKTESLLIWQSLVVDAHSGHFLYHPSAWENGKLHSRNELTNMMADLVCTAFGKGPNIGTGPSVSIIRVNEQDRSKAERHELFGNPNVPDFIKTARQLIWDTTAVYRKTSLNYLVF